MAKLDQRLAPDSCACGSNKKYKECCGRFLDGSTLPATAEMLMRSRYTAYTLLREDYLLTTWHASTRPEKLGLVEEKNSQWLGLQVKRHEQQDETHALVEFVARYKTAGRAQRLHEVSRFIREGERWFYVDDDIE
jgi:SEC-C motif-containing protein